MEDTFVSGTPTVAQTMAYYLEAVALSRSANTARTYRQGLQAFRTSLHGAGFDAATLEARHSAHRTLAIRRARQAVDRVGGNHDERAGPDGSDGFVDRAHSGSTVQPTERAASDSRRSKLMIGSPSVAPATAAAPR